MADEKTWDCPATGFKEPCRKDKCPEWVHVFGMHPQSKVQLDLMDCARRWVPVLLINVGNEMRMCAASMESARNEVAKGDLAKIDATEQLVGEVRQALEQRRDAKRVPFFRRLLPG